VPRPGTRRRELLAIAADLFAASGFHAVSMDDIGAAAGISGPALYHHFRSKEAMLGEMLVDISQQLLDGANSLAQSSSADLVDLLVDFHCDFAVTNPSLITVHFRDLIHVPTGDRSKVRRLQAHYVTVWVDALLVRAPDLDAGVADAATRAIFGLINSTPYSATLPNARMRPLLDALAHGAIEAVVAAADRSPRRGSVTRSARTRRTSRSTSGRPGTRR
jgi:AcrR family transcriptional regulator